jgi:hypothetical protein
MPDVEYHAETHEPNSVDPRAASYEIKLFPDVNYATNVLDDAELADVVAGDGMFIWEVPPKVGGCRLVFCRAYVTDGTGPVEIQLRNTDNGDVDMLDVPLTIDSGDKSSRTASAEPEPDPATNRVSEGDQIAIDIDVAGGSGLGLIIQFSS